MSIFKKKGSIRKETAPISGVRDLHDGSITKPTRLIHDEGSTNKELASLQNTGESITKDASEGDNKQGQAQSGKSPRPPHVVEAVSIGPEDAASVYPVASTTIGSQNTVPYHLPWTKKLVSSHPIQAIPPREKTDGSVRFLKSSAKKKDDTFLKYSQKPLDPKMYQGYFTSSDRNGADVDMERRMALKRSKAPLALNIMVAGAKNSGKTSWIRTLLSTCDLSQSREEVKRAAMLFGISPSHEHPTRDTDPITPLPTDTYHTIGGIEITPDALAPLSALESGANEWKSEKPQRRGSVLSRTHSISSQPIKKIHLSICDTPGLDFEREDDFEIERKFRDLLHHVESKLSETLSEESKVNRQHRGDNHKHLLLFFIDPRSMVEHTSARKGERNRSMYDNSKAALTDTNLYEQIRSVSLYGKEQEFDAAQHVSSRPEQDNSIKKDMSDTRMLVDQIPSQQLKILARLSERVNVFPIIAKADTLTSAQLEDVRESIRKSLLISKVNLGPFKVAPLKKFTEHGYCQYPSDQGDDEPLETLSSSDVSSDEPVRVIRLRPRRSYSVSSGMGTSVSSHDSTTEDYPTGRSEEDHSTSFAHTEPLFDRGNKDSGNRLGNDPMHADLEHQIPLAIFVPEPIRVRAAQKHTVKDESHYDTIPPVPQIPVELASSLVASQSMTLNHAKVPQFPMRPLPPPPPQSNRFKRQYRFGEANVLDPQQCDFGLLRAIIMESHIEALRETTTRHYERFRSERLELGRQLSNNEGSINDLRSQ